MSSEKIAEFGKIWRGGYYEGDPARYAAPSSYKMYGYISVTRAVYLTCIRPYVGPDSVVLEIGPGRGAWTKCIASHSPRKIYAVDVVSAEHSGFWSHVGKRENVEYIQVSDLLLSDIPDGGIDYFFSFGVFCHLPPEMCEQYVRSLSQKMKSGARGFLMIADFDKFNDCIDRKEETSLLAALSSKKFFLLRIALHVSLALKKYKFDFPRLSKGAGLDATGTNSKFSHWYHWGIDEACAALQQAGFEIVEKDMDQMPRDPMIHFRKPVAVQ